VRVSEEQEAVEEAGLPLLTRDINEDVMVFLDASALVAAEDTDSTAENTAAEAQAAATTASASAPDTSTLAALLEAEIIVGNFAAARTEVARRARSFSARRRERMAEESLESSRRRRAACASAA
jgi:hypothetical protein